MDVPKPKTNHPHESTWDDHGNTKWTYVSDEAKQRIGFFLRRRLGGRNLDIGGGWYLHYPNSAVVDLSSVCLANNPAQEKVQFDLDELHNGKRLPFPDYSFDSATMISTWQYLEHPDALLDELKRVLKPGAEVYVINGQNAGREGCILGIGNTKGIAEHLQTKGFDTLIEHIPFGNDTLTFQSVCFSIPERDLFGSVSEVRDKAKRKRADERIVREPEIFEDDFINYELGIRRGLLAKLNPYPVTAYSQDFLARTEEFGKALKRAGIDAVIYAEHTPEVEVDMLLPNQHSSCFLALFDRFSGVDKYVEQRREQDDLIQTLSIAHGVFFPTNTSDLNMGSKEDLLRNCKEFDLDERNAECSLRTYADFVASVGMTSGTRRLQAQVQSILRKRASNFDEVVRRQKAFGYNMLTAQFKQERSIADLLLIKQRVERGEIPSVGQKNLDYQTYLHLMERWIRVNDCETSMGDFD